MSERTFLWTITDPRGLPISLAEDVWRVHVAYRPELATHLDWISITIKDPDGIYFDPTSTPHKSGGTEVYWYYRTAPLTDKFAGNYVAVIVKVVVEAQGKHGYVASAMLPSRILKRLVKIWNR